MASTTDARIASRVVRVAAPLAVLLVAAAFRLWGLDALPPGLQFDEAHNAIDAVRVLEGARPWFFPDNGGREPLVTYLHAPALAAVGRDHAALALRLVSALAGIATVAVVFGFARRFFRDATVGVLSGAFLAVSYWHVHFSRYGIRAILAPLWTTLAMWSWWTAIGEPERDDAPAPRTRLLGAAACGAFLAAAVYSHPSGRLLPLVLVGHAVYRTVSSRGARARSTWGALLVAGSVSLVLFAPFGLYFLDHPVHFTGHPSDVSLTAVAEADYGGSVWRAALGNARAVAGMLFVAGDPSTFHNLPGLPVFDPVTALLAVIGLGVLLGALASPARPRRDRAVLLTVWLVVLLLPTLLSDRPPNYSRAIAALPVIVMLPALGARWTVDRLTGLSRAAKRSAIVGVLVLAGAWTAWHYFHVFAHLPHVYASYDVDKQDAFLELARRADGANVFLHPLWARHASIAYLNRAGTVRELDGHNTAVTPDNGRETLIALPAKEHQREGWDETIADLYGAVSNRTTIRDAQGEPALVVHRLGVGALDEPSALGLRAPDAPIRFGTAIELTAYDVGRLVPGRPVPVTLLWTSRAPVDADFTVFVHLQDADGANVGQMDREPAWASYRTSKWAPGDAVLDRYLPVLAEGARGPVSVVVGWYDATTGERVPMGDNDALTLGVYEVER